MSRPFPSLACAIAIALLFPNVAAAGPGTPGGIAKPASAASAGAPRCPDSQSDAARSPDTALAPCSGGAEDRQASAALTCEQRLVGSRNMRATFCKPKAAGEMLADANP